MSKSVDLNQFSSQVGKYLVGKTLGTGSFGKVKMGFNLETKKEIFRIRQVILQSEGLFCLVSTVDVYYSQVALKLMHIPREDQKREMAQLKREIRLMKLLKHENIAQLFEIFEDEELELIYMAMEYIPGGDLFHYLTTHGDLGEQLSRKMFRQMVEALSYTHNHLIVHRDLKPENILLDSDNNVKLCDFGNLMKLGEKFTSRVGSPYYQAPEIHKNEKYIGPEVDIWSLGVILYVMVTGSLPWIGDSMPERVSKCIEARYKIPPFVSQDCCHLITRMLEVDPKHRATLEEIRLHPWSSEGFDAPPRSWVPSHEVLRVEDIDQETVTELVGLGFDREELTRDLTSPEAFTNQTTVMYHLFQDHKETEKRMEQMEKMLQRRGSYPPSQKKKSRPWPLKA